MKKTTKALALALCAVLLVVGTALTTVAYLTSTTETVVNTFSVGDVEITLDEAKVNKYGEVQGTERVKENSYTLIPGVPYTKDPTVTVKANSEECYVRMIVTVSNLAKVKEVFGTVNVNGNEYFLPQNFVAGWNPEIWKTTNVIKEENDTATYEFRYYKPVDTVGEETNEDLKLEALFNTFTVPGTVKETDLEKLNEETFVINVVAHAIQSAGFDTEDLAWEAFDAQKAANK